MTDDAGVVGELLGQIDADVERFTGDGAYDKRPVYEALTGRGATVVVPPSRTAVVSGKSTPVEVPLLACRSAVGADDQACVSSPSASAGFSLRLRLGRDRYENVVGGGPGCVSILQSPAVGLRTERPNEAWHVDATAHKAF